MRAFSLGVNTHSRREDGRYRGSSIGEEYYRLSARARRLVRLGASAEEISEAWRQAGIVYERFIAEQRMRAKKNRGR